MKQKNNSIEFFRFVCSLMVMYFHAESMTLLSARTHVFALGGTSVTFFAVLSGFLFARSFRKQPRQERILAGTFRNLIKRISSFAFLWYVCLILTAVVRVHYYQFDRLQTWLWLKENWAEFFMLNGAFYNVNHINGSTWYISALLLCTFGYELLLRAGEKWFRIPVFALAAVCGAGLYLANAFGGVLIFRAQELTAFAMQFPFGIVGYYAYEKMQKVRWTGSKRSVLQVAEVLLAAAFFAFFFVPVSRQLAPPAQRFLLILISAGLICILFLHQTALSHWLDCRLCGILGKISVGIYMSHMMLLVRWGWAPPFNLELMPLRAYIVIGVEAILLGVFFTGVNEAVQCVRNRLRQKKARAV